MPKSIYQEASEDYSSGSTAICPHVVRNIDGMDIELFPPAYHTESIPEQDGIIDTLKRLVSKYLLP